MDLSSLHSIQNFTKNWKPKKLDILINNAGLVSPYETTVDGYEIMFATNHLGPFYLTHLLWEKLKLGAPSKVINLASRSHHFQEVHLNDIEGLNTWRNGSGLTSYLGDYLHDLIGIFKAYGQSKTANVLFTVELAKRMKNFGTTYSLHPGSIRTGLGHQGNPSEYLNMILDNLPFVWKTTNQGASTTLFCLLNPNLTSGDYFSNCQVEEARSYATDAETARKLWLLSEKMINNVIPNSF